MEMADVAVDDEVDLKRKTRSVEETAKILGMGLSATYEAVRDGRIPSVRFGRKYLVPVVVINRLIGEATK